MGILAICGNIISTLTAYFSAYKHDDIKNGGKLVLVMGNKANESWGIKDVPPSGESVNKLISL